MSDEQDNDILELTDSMEAGEEPAEESDAGSEDANSGEASKSKALPRPSASPFTLLAKPRSREERRESRPSVPPEDAEEPRPSFVPSPNSDAVVASPVVSLGGKENVPEEAEKKEAEDKVEEKETEKAEEEETEKAEEEETEKAEEEETEKAEGQTGSEDEIMDLGQEFAVEADEESPAEAAVESEETPIDLTRRSLPPETSSPPEPPPSPEEPTSDAEGKDDATGDEDESEPVDLGEEHVLEGEGSVPPAPPEAAETPFDFGTPEMVFDADVAEHLDEIEELGDDEIEEEPPDEVEIDLNEAEDLTGELRPMSESFLKQAAAKQRKGGGGRRRRRRAKKEWWTRIFDDDYLTVIPPYTKRDTRRDVDFIQNNLMLNPGALVLDLACGSGRHAVALAKRNFRIVGVDLSLSMLAKAGETAQDAGQKINFIHGDMRDLGFDRTFDGVFCLGTSLGFFDEETNKKVLEGVYKALKPGASFLLELANRDYAINAQPNLQWFEMDGVVCMEETDFNYINSRLYVTRQLIINGGARQAKHEFSVRLYSLHEIGQMLHEAGFAVTKVSGHQATPGAFFGTDSSRMLIVAERRR